MDIVYLRKLKAPAIIGVFEWEKGVEQELFIDLDVSRGERCNTIPAVSDDIKDAIDYAGMASGVRAFVAASRYDLIETLAEDLATFLFANFDLSYAKIKVAKPTALAEALEVGVVIERYRT